jgi:hypothetical protein
MPQLTIEYRTDKERLILEQAIAYVTDLSRLALAAPDGKVLPMCEQHALGQGRQLLRSSLATALEGRIDVAEQKGGPLAPVPRRTPDARKDSTRAPS